MCNANLIQTNNNFKNYYHRVASQANDCLRDTISPGIYIYDVTATNIPGNSDRTGGVILTLGYLKVWTTRIAISNSLRLFISLYTPGSSYGEWKEV